MGWFGKGLIEKGDIFVWLLYSFSRTKPERSLVKRETTAGVMGSVKFVCFEIKKKSGIDKQCKCKNAFEFDS